MFTSYQIATLIISLEFCFWGFLTGVITDDKANVSQLLTEDIILFLIISKVLAKTVQEFNINVENKH